jgi:hypothetical protein
VVMQGWREGLGCSDSLNLNENYGHTQNQCEIYACDFPLYNWILPENDI